MDAKEVLREMSNTIKHGTLLSNRARAAVAEAYERLDALERECEGLRALSGKWRAEADTERDDYDGPDYMLGVDETLLNCADDLDAALRLTGAGEG